MLTLLTREITENIITAGSHAFARSIIQTIYDRSLALANNNKGARVALLSINKLTL